MREKVRSQVGLSYPKVEEEEDSLWKERGDTGLLARMQASAFAPARQARDK